MGLTKPKITGGAELPELSNPAGAANIQSGYEAVDGEGNLISGTHTEASLTDLLPALSNPAGTANIQSGYDAVNSAGQVVTGSAVIPTYKCALITCNAETVYHNLGGLTSVDGSLTYVNGKSVRGYFKDKTFEAYTSSGSSQSYSRVTATTTTYGGLSQAFQGRIVCINDSTKTSII